MLKDIVVEVKKASQSVLPIYFLVVALTVFRVFSLSLYEIACFSSSTVLVVLGIALFSYGADNAMMPIGRTIGSGLTKQGKISVLLAVVFLFGFLITVAEPDLTVLAAQTQSVFPKMALILSISLAVGVFLVFAILRIIHKISLSNVLSFMYMAVFAIVALLAAKGMESMAGLCFDSGGVTTGPMTVPFLMALGAGVAAVLAKKSDTEASFGFVAFSSAGPVLMMLILSLFVSGDVSFSQSAEALSPNFPSALFFSMLAKLREVGLAIGMLFVCFIITDRLCLHLDRERMLHLCKGMIFAYAGLVVFLAAVDASYMGIGYKIGSQMASLPLRLSVSIAFVIGALVVIAEPAIRILVSQVEETTSGMIRQNSLLAALAFGSGVVISIAVLRIVFRFSILYVVIPGYIICFALSFFIPKIYTAIAFDAGGVASGPLTSSFILPVALGLCLEANGEDAILSYGFGVVALVALSPLVFIELLGVVSLFTSRQKAKTEIKSIMKKDLKMTISFSDRHGKRSLARLYFLVVVVPKGKNEVVADVMEDYNVTFFLNTLARGSADKSLTKDIVFCVIREDRVKDALLKLEDKFVSFGGKISMAYAIPFENVIGVSSYMAFSDGGRT